MIPFVVFAAIVRAAVMICVVLTGAGWERPDQWQILGLAAAVVLARTVRHLRCGVPLSFAAFVGMLTPISPVCLLKRLPEAISANVAVSVASWHRPCLSGSFCANRWCLLAEPAGGPLTRGHRLGFGQCLRGLRVERSQRCTRYPGFASPGLDGAGIPVGGARSGPECF